MTSNAQAAAHLRSITSALHNLAYQDFSEAEAGVLEDIDFQIWDFIYAKETP
jgi:hypothetical protein